MDRNGQNFARDAGKHQAGFLRELADFMRANKKWWLAPIIIALLVVALLVILGGSAVAPFIYPLV
jgi:hypothetical protein